MSKKNNNTKRKPIGKGELNKETKEVKSVVMFPENEDYPKIKGWRMNTDDVCDFLSRCKDAKLEVLKVWLNLLPRMKFENYVFVQQKDICEAIGMSKANVSRAFKKLIEFEILEKVEDKEIIDALIKRYAIDDWDNRGYVYYFNPFGDFRGHHIKAAEHRQKWLHKKQIHDESVYSYRYFQDREEIIHSNITRRNVSNKSVEDTSMPF